MFIYNHYFQFVLLFFGCFTMKNTYCFYYLFHIYYLYLFSCLKSNHCYTHYPNIYIFLLFIVFHIFLIDYRVLGFVWKKSMSRLLENLRFKEDVFYLKFKIVKNVYIYGNYFKLPLSKKAN